MSASLVDETEFLGTLVDAEEITEAEAAHCLQVFSDGGLTLMGAAELMATWRVARARYRAVGEQAHENLRGLS